VEPSLRTLAQVQQSLCRPAAECALDQPGRRITQLRALARSTGGLSCVLYMGLVHRDAYAQPRLRTSRKHFMIWILRCAQRLDELGVCRAAMPCFRRRLLWLLG
jgi:hypothetical protein